MSAKAFVDTNIIVYSYEQSAHDRERQEACRRLVLSCFEGKTRLAVSNQVLAEFLFVITRKADHPIGSDEAQELLELFLSSDYWVKVNYTAATLRRAAALAATAHVPFWDALIGATMIENDIFTIYTGDEKGFSRIPGVKVINPAKG